MLFKESGIKFTFPANNVYKADSKEHQYNGLSAVDFVIEKYESTYAQIFAEHGVSGA